MSSIMASRKIVWPAGILLVGLYFFPSILKVTHHFIPTQVTVQENNKPKPPNPPQPPAQTPKPSPAEVSLQSLTGTWVGQKLVEKRGICTLKFEITPAQPNEFTGYSTLTCAYTPLLPNLPKPGTVAAVDDFMSPVSSFLSGKQVGKSMQFSVDKTLGDICPPTSFTLTPFSAELAAEWQDASCGGGYVVMARAK